MTPNPIHDDSVRNWAAYLQPLEENAAQILMSFSSPPSETRPYVSSLSSALGDYVPAAATHISPAQPSSLSPSLPTESPLPQPTSLPQSPSTSSVDASYRHSEKERIPRPPNAFILFRSDFLKRNVIPPEVENHQATLSQVAGRVWNSLPSKEKEKWRNQAKEASLNHMRKYPDYRFTPHYPKRAEKKSDWESKGPTKGLENGSRAVELCKKFCDNPGSSVSLTRQRRRCGGDSK